MAGEPTPDDMGGKLWAKQAPARGELGQEPGVFPDALNGKAAAAPAKKAAKKATKKK